MTVLSSVHPVTWRRTNWDQPLPWVMVFTCWHTPNGLITPSCPLLFFSVSETICSKEKKSIVTYKSLLVTKSRKTSKNSKSFCEKTLTRIMVLVISSVRRETKELLLSFLPCYLCTCHPEQRLHLAFSQTAFPCSQWFRECQTCLKSAKCWLAVCQQLL